MRGRGKYSFLGMLGRRFGRNYPIRANAVKNVRKLRVRIDSHKRVYLGKVNLRFVRVPLGKASENDKFNVPILLVLSHVQNGIDTLFDCGLNESACVYDDYIRFGRILRKLVPVVYQHCQYVLGVHAVFVASKRYHAYFAFAGVLFTIHR